MIPDATTAFRFQTSDQIMEEVGKVSFVMKAFLVRRYGKPTERVAVEAFEGCQLPSVRPVHGNYSAMGAAGMKGFPSKAS